MSTTTRHDREAENVSLALDLSHQPGSAGNDVVIRADVVRGNTAVLTGRKGAC